MDRATVWEPPAVVDTLSQDCFAFSRSDRTPNSEVGLSQRQMQDEALVSRVHSGNTEAFYSLVEPHLSSARYLVGSLIRNRADVDDVIQDAILTAFIKLRQLRSSHLFRAWFIQIALNTARLKMRREKAQQFTESLDEVPWDHPATVPHQLIDRGDLPSRKVEIKELGDMLREALAYLPGYYREVILLSDIQQLSMREIAASLGLSVSLVKTRLHRARLRMRKSLSPLLRPRAAIRRFSRPEALLLEEEPGQPGSRKARSDRTDFCR